MPFDSDSAADAGAKSKRGLSERTKILNALFTEDKAQKVFGQLEKQALAGELDAIKTYLAYCFGKPKETMDLNIPEGIRIILKKANSGH